MASYGSCEDGDLRASLLEQGKRRISLTNNSFCRYPLTTILSVIDEDPREGDYEDLDECEIQRRQSMHYELKKSWKLGLFLAVLSGIFFTATSIMIQYFRVPALEIFLVRSLFQSIVMGMVAAASPYNRRCVTPESGLTWRVKLWIIMQALLGAIRLYLNYVLLAYLPLGDAVTIMFIEPLFTVFLSFVLLRIAAGIWKLLLCLGLLVGMILTVQPPFIFGSDASHNNATNDHNLTTIFTEVDTLEDKEDKFGENYYKGVFMAIGCAVMGALCNILITKCDKIRSTVLVFYGGAAGVVVALIGWIADPESSKTLISFEDLRAFDWLLLSMISIIGLAAIFAMTAALKMISPTSVSVLKATEIVFAFLFQMIVMHQMPNALCVIGATLVIASIIGISIEERYAEERNSQRPLQPGQRRRPSMPAIVQIGPNFVVLRSNQHQ